MGLMVTGAPEGVVFQRHIAAAVGSRRTSCQMNSAVRMRWICMTDQTDTRRSANKQHKCRVDCFHRHILLRGRPRILKRITCWCPVCGAIRYRAPDGGLRAKRPTERKSRAEPVTTESRSQWVLEKGFMAISLIVTGCNIGHVVKYCSFCPVYSMLSFDGFLTNVWLQSTMLLVLHILVIFWLPGLQTEEGGYAWCTLTWIRPCCCCCCCCMSDSKTL